MSKPVALGESARAVMDAWADKIVSQKALPDHIVGLIDNGGGVIEREFIYEEYEGIPIFAVVSEGKNVRAASMAEYAEVEKAITDGKFVIREHNPSWGVTVVIHEAVKLPTLGQSLKPDSGPSL